MRTPPTLSPGTARGTELLCVAAVMPHKGHDTLLASLAIIADLPWRCVCVGPLDRDPRFVDRTAAPSRNGRHRRPDLVHRRAVNRELDRRYAAADVVVHASYAETFGMVVIEALARGLPVIASAVGGVPDALGRTADGRPSRPSGAAPGPARTQRRPVQLAERRAMYGDASGEPRRSAERRSLAGPRPRIRSREC